MSLVLSGVCLGVSKEIVNGPTGPFESVTIAVLSGEGADSNVEKVRPARDFPASQYPTEGENVRLNVVISTWAGRNGTGYRLTALSRAAALSAAAPAQKAS